MKTKTKIIIIGGGFAGFQLAQHLEDSFYDVLLIDKQNHHQFQPLYYQVASGSLEPSSISFPFRKIFQNSKNIQIRMAEVNHIDTAKNMVETDIGNFDYDRLIIATGCKTNYFGNAELAKYAYPMKTTQEAIEIRNNVLRTFERIISASEAEKEALLNIVIVGAGPTGVELSGAFADVKSHVLPRDYPTIDFSALKIILLEGSKNTLNNMGEESRKASREYLEELGVTVRTEVVVKSYDGETVTLVSGETIKSKNVIWTAGVTGNTISGFNPDVIVKGNRFKVDRHNKINGYDNIYAIGDIAYMETPKYPQGHPQLANVAINQGKLLAKNFKLLLENKPLKEYEYTDLGSMATIGKHKAVVELPFIKFQGRLAWYAWMFIHLMLILGVKSKLIIFINWAWAYFTKDSSLRLIFSKGKDVPS